MPQLLENLSSNGLGLLVALGLSWLIWTILLPKGQYRGELFNDRARFEWFYTKARRRFLESGGVILNNAFKKSENAFYVMTSREVEIVLNPKYMHEVRNDDRFAVTERVDQLLHGDVPGFGIIKHSAQTHKIFSSTFQSRVVREIGGFLVPIFEEIDHFLETQWTDNKEWHAFSLHPSMVQLVSQESTRLFLGPEMCRDAHWLQASVNYIQSFFMGIDLLDSWRPIFRPLVSKFSQTGKQIRSDLAEARQILSPFIADRQARKANGEKFNDLLQWFDDAARGAEYDAPLLILRSSMAAVHSTSDLLTKAIFEICTQPGLIDDIREEAIRVFKEHGLRQTAIQELRLTDSVLKETQRLKPLQTTAFIRLTKEDVVLSDGLEIPKGTPIRISNHHMWDPEVSEYPKADQFDGYRFYKLRQVPGQEQTAQLATVSPSHTGFGLGKHACPGRFFAATATKVILCKILLDYDLELLDGQRPKTMWRGDAQVPDPMCQIVVRRRKEEFNLSSLLQDVK